MLQSNAGLLTLHRRESAIEALQPKPGSPAWLVEEVEAVRRGLMDLLHNVVLLRCPDSDKEFTPVRPHPEANSGAPAVTSASHISDLKARPVGDI